MKLDTFDKNFEKTVVADKRLGNLKLITFYCNDFRLHYQVNDLRIAPLFFIS